MNDSPRERFNHFLTLATRWADLDTLGHINNVQLVQYLECGRIAYCADVLGIDFAPPVHRGWLLADLQCSFRSQLHFPSTVDVASRIHTLGNSSARLTGSIFKRNESTPVLSSEAVLVWFDYPAQQAVRIPDSVRRTIEEFEGGVESTGSR